MSRVNEESFSINGEIVIELLYLRSWMEQYVTLFSSDWNIIGLASLWSIVLAFGRFFRILFWRLWIRFKIKSRGLVALLLVFVECCNIRSRISFRVCLTISSWIGS